MSRYTGPNNKKSRRLKFSILENNKEFIKGKKRTVSPGQHGAKNQKLSNYGSHLYEKQKVRFMYGLSEKQLKNTFEKATKMKGVLGTNLLILLESRLDNIVYRAGLANTRRQSRQFVNHGLIKVNDKKVDIPSYNVKVGDVISVKEKHSENFFMKDNLLKRMPVEFVSFDAKEMKGKYERLPEREELSGQINEALLVEFYNK
ncbi:MAG: 30S ribosomal protein S4 [Candidatus Tyloplasma litorale]|nr:MAG: 30S ribosomal protein S4 [Mycoplasmatales bacterium]